MKKKICEHPNCPREAEHKAPKDRRLKDYHWFCFEHARAYNKSWNFYAGMSMAEIEDDQKNDMTWQKPTWHFGGLGKASFPWDKVRDYFNLFEDFRAEVNASKQGAPNTPQASTKESAALKEMDLNWPLTEKNLKSRYKTLAKKFHPDLTGNDKKAEERFKEIGEAYRILLKFLKE